MSAPLVLWGDSAVTSLSPTIILGFPCGSAGKNLPAMQETQRMWVQSLGLEDPLEWGMATHSSILAKKNLVDRGVW